MFSLGRNTHDEYIERYGLSKIKWKEWMKASQEGEALISDIQVWEDHVSKLREVREVIDFLKRTDSYTRTIDGAFGRIYRGSYKDGDGKIIAESFKKYEIS